MGASASREKFRESVTALIEVDVSPDDADFWDELWKIPSSAEEVFELISPDSARRLRDERFDNLATLFTQATAQLCQIVETPYSIYFDQALNCVRVLTRVLPFLLEKGDLGDSDPMVEQLCWSTGAQHEDDDGIRATDSIVGKIIGGKDGDDDSAAAKTGHPGMESSVDDDSQEPLALLVVHAAMHMLFLPQFTCDFYEEDPDDGATANDSSFASVGKPKKNIETEWDDEANLTQEQIEKKRKEEARQAKEDKDMKTEAGLGKTKHVDNGIILMAKPTSIVWSAGVGVKPNQLGYEGGTRKFDKNRIEVLRLLLASCCDPLYSPADEYNPLASRWLAVAVAADSPNAVCLFYSLLNTILSYDPNGIGVPYSSAFASDTHVKLVELSAQVLCVLLDSGLPGNPEPVSNAYDDPIVEFHEASKGGFNIFRTLLARIDSGKDLTFVYKGFTKLLKNVYESKNTLLPNSSKCLQCYQELLVLFWKMLEENPVFMNHILTQCDSNEIVVPICYLMYQSRKDPTQIGLVHICTFVLLKLSGERSFGVNLNKPFNIKLPCDLPLFTGGHADLITITLHKLIVNGAYKLVPLYSCFLTVICNISPYWRSMSLVAAVKLVNLFELFSSPKFLYSSENAHRHLALLLEVFNNVVQYQYNGNHHLVYAIIRRKDSFGRLSSLTLKKALAACEKVYGETTALKLDHEFDDKKKDIVSLQNVDNSGNPVVTRKRLSKDDDHETNSVDETTIGSSTLAGVRFQPNDEWILELKESLPLETITRLLQHIVPVVDEIVNKKKGVVDEVEILEVLKEITMVGLLPVPHAIVIRKYQPNQYTALWFTAFLWGVIFLRNQSLPIFDGEAVELFQVSVGQDEE